MNLGVGGRVMLGKVLQVIFLPLYSFLSLWRSSEQTALCWQAEEDALGAAGWYWSCVTATMPYSGCTPGQEVFHV